ncbi:formimidoylglutamate deiminase [Phenylobacterium montanum]|uniref:Formimidoylglutamate deiminase n=1 Tax=Phenylobacterium montanum TaxID=2823693 RepID=A0A975IV97_9CAUL|nr:formimidoylglutamate deiminase [Caulobacter sp. S6]
MSRHNIQVWHDGLEQKETRVTGALWFETVLLPGGWADRVRMAEAGGKIAAVEIGAEPQQGDERVPIGLPGLPNIHSHAFQRGMAGLAEARGHTDDDFWSWREVMYRFVDRLNPDDVEAIAAQAFAEMLEGGFTRVGEFHYLHHDLDGHAYADPAELSARIAAAASATGIGLTLLPVFYAHSGFGGAPPSHGQRRFINDPDRFAKLAQAAKAACAGLPDAVVGVAPHSLRAVTPDELALVSQVFRDAPMHIHIAEQVREVEDCLAWSGRRPVAWLLDEAGADARWCLVHATHVTEAETGALARTGAVAGICPVTEANLGDGVFPTDRYLAAGGAFAVGSDSNILISAAEELRTLEYAQRLTRRARNVLAGGAGTSTGRTLFDGALAGGAQALGVSGEGLAVGAPLDVVSLNAESPSLIGRRGDELLDAWIFAARPGAVDRVWRRGRKVVEGGRHVAAEPIAARYRRTLEKVLAD